MCLQRFRDCLHIVQDGRNTDPAAARHEYHRQREHPRDRRLGIGLRKGLREPTPDVARDIHIRRVRYRSLQPRALACLEHRLECIAQGGVELFLSHRKFRGKACLRQLDDRIAGIGGGGEKAGIGKHARDLRRSASISWERLTSRNWTADTVSDRRSGTFCVPDLSGVESRAARCPTYEPAALEVLPHAIRSTAAPVTLPVRNAASASLA